MAKKSKRRKPIAAARAAQASIKPQPVAHELTLLSEAEQRTRRSRYTIWRQVKARQFPQPIKLGFRRIAFRTADIDAVVAGTWSAAT
jgi:predicted DNA-binding transcriptional regulator AlpA